MKKIFCILITLICFITCVRAQKRETAIIDYFGNGRDVPFIFSEQIRGQVIEGFVKRDRLDVIDAERIPAMRPTYPTMYSSVADIERERNDAIISTGARYIVSGYVSDCKFSRSGSGETTQFNSTFRVVLKAYDLLLNKELAPEQYELSGQGSKPDEADWRAISQIAGRMNFYIESRMKFETIVLQMAQPDSKGRSLDLYIGSGSNIGVKRGDQFVVFAEDMIQGRVIRTELGKITVSDVNGPDVSLCTMKKKQAADIINAFNAGKRLVAVSAGEAFFSW